MFIKNGYFLSLRIKSNKSGGLSIFRTYFSIFGLKINYNHELIAALQLKKLIIER